MVVGAAAAAEVLVRAVAEAAVKAKVLVGSVGEMGVWAVVVEVWVGSVVEAVWKAATETAEAVVAEAPVRVEVATKAEMAV